MNYRKIGKGLGSEIEFDEKDSVWDTTPTLAATAGQNDVALLSRFWLCAGNFIAGGWIWIWIWIWKFVPNPIGRIQRQAVFLKVASKRHNPDLLPRHFKRIEPFGRLKYNATNSFSHDCYMIYLQSGVQSSLVRRRIIYMHTKFERMMRQWLFFGGEFRVCLDTAYW